MGKKMKKLLILSIIFVSGCSTFTPPQKHPVISEEFTLEKGEDIKLVLSNSTANRRVVIADLSSGSICVEPPPESANSISSTLAAVLDADIEGKAKLVAEISKSSSQQINQLYRRTQAVQMYRDAIFSLCQEKLNDYMQALNKSESDSVFMELTKSIDIKYNEKSDMLLEKSLTLLEKEIPEFYQTEKFRFISETIKPVIVCDNEREIVTNAENEVNDSSNNQEDDSGALNNKQEDSNTKIVTTMKSGCRAVFPTGTSELLKAYAEIIKSSK